MEELLGAREQVSQGEMTDTGRQEDASVFPALFLNTEATKAESRRNGRTRATLPSEILSRRRACGSAEPLAGQKGTSR